MNLAKETGLVQLRENRARHKIDRGEAAYVISGHNSTHMIDFLGQFNPDGIWIEGEHGPVDFSDIPDMTRACDLWGMTSVVRVNLNIPGVIYRTLDLGAQSIVVPHVDTAEQAQQVANAAKFAPIGNRGMFGSRQSYGVPDYLEKANDETLSIILIEDIAAVNNLADIVKVDGIDVFFVAPSDLAQSMGHIGQVDHPEVQSTIDRAIDQINNAGRTSGTLANDANVERYIANGVKFVMTSWTAWIADGLKGFQAKMGG